MNKDRKKLCPLLGTWLYWLFPPFMPSSLPLPGFLPPTKPLTTLSGLQSMLPPWVKWQTWKVPLTPAPCTVHHLQKKLLFSGTGGLQPSHPMSLWGLSLLVLSSTGHFLLEHISSLDFYILHPSVLWAAGRTFSHLALPKFLYLNFPLASLSIRRTRPPG